MKLMTLSDCQALADATMQHLHCEPVECRVKEIQRGRAGLGRGWVSIPLWAIKKGERYASCYVLHELAHHLLGHGGHGDDFKEMEQMVLSLWGFSITYKKAYAKTLSLAGETFYKAPVRHRVSPKRQVHSIIVKNGVTMYQTVWR